MDGTCGPVGFVDETRGVLRMSGPDARAVLQGIATNDVETVAADRAVYAALLTPQGKYLFDFFLVADGADVLIDAALDRIEDLSRRLKMYSLRRDARIERDPDLRVFLAWMRDGAPREGKTAPPLHPGATALPDPRDARLGWRVYGATPPEIPTASRADYDAVRVALVIPESGRELLAEQTYILEAGFERLNGVDFRKGCYVGQEVTARMKHKAELRKGLVAVRVAGAAAEGAELTAQGKPAGRLFTQSGGRGLAHLRFDRAQGELRAGDAVVRYDPDSSAASAASPSR